LGADPAGRPATRRRDHVDPGRDPPGRRRRGRPGADPAAGRATQPSGLRHVTASGFSPAWPMAYLKTYGPRADPVTGLTWGLMDLSLAVIAIVTVLVVVGVIARRQRLG